jgi:hypothetical protein
LVFGLLTVALGTTILQNYGLALFCGVPLSMGILAPLLHGMGARRSYWELLFVSMLAQVVLLLAMIVFALEGFICIFMAAPLWIGVATIGTSLAYAAHVYMWQDFNQEARGFPIILLLLVLATPTWMGAEHVAPSEPPLLKVSTSLDIAASPKIVWQRVLAFPDMPPPDDWLFCAGVAYPLHAVVIGHGAGAVRYCVFSTGPFVEPITTWDDQHKLAFNVTKSPPTMRELSPYDIHPAHLEGYFISRKGQFELINLGNGRTRLIGTTWYQNRMFPTAYWRIWSDLIIRRIHQRVLAHIATYAEKDFSAVVTDGGVP